MQMIGASPSCLAAVQMIRRVARCDASVLVEGETGTGKELAARMVHYQSARRDGPFIPLNCGAIPDSLLESELFGHSQGAFTDAKQSSPGILLLAQGGTLLLDEVDALTNKAQVALLRFLQERTVRAVGAREERRVSVRVVAASNRNLRELADSGAFRKDLYYRLNVLYVVLPPLRQRGADVLMLAETFLAGLAARHGCDPPAIDERSRNWMLNYAWPGNIRELENLVEREFLMAEGARTLVFGAASDEQKSEAPRQDREDLNYRAAKARLLAEFDRRFLQNLMCRTKGNITEAARVAGKERRDFGKLLRKYAIVPEQFRPRG